MTGLDVISGKICLKESKRLLLKIRVLHSEMIGGSLPTMEKARRFIAKIANLLSAKAEMGAPMICMYLLGNPDQPMLCVSFLSYS